MANPTTNFGWVMPTSSSLVTNLPADFNTFGQAVDTSMSELLGGTTGQVLSKTSNTNMDFTWVTPTDQTPLTTKGDLFTFTTVDARLGVGTDGQTLVADSSTATGLKWATAAGGGKVLQVVYARYATEGSTNTNTYVTTGMSATITPSSTSSKVLCLVKTRYEFDSGTAYTGAAFQLWRGGSSIVQLDTQIMRNSDVFARINDATTSHYLDSPATTSAITYTVYGAIVASSGATVIFQANNSQSDMVLMEIGA